MTDEERIAAALEWIENLTPEDLGEPEDTSDLRAVTRAVGVARANGRSWGRISMAIGRDFR